MIGLNPFMNQVYFYQNALRTVKALFTECLNPFMNQVYFYYDRCSDIYIEALGS